MRSKKAERPDDRVAIFGKRLFFSVVAFVIVVLVIGSLTDSDPELPGTAPSDSPARAATQPLTVHDGPTPGLEHADNRGVPSALPFVPSTIAGFELKRRGRTPALDLRVYGATAGWQADYRATTSPYPYHDLRVDVWLYESVEAARDFYEAEPPKRSDRPVRQAIGGVAGTLAPSRGRYQSELSYFQLRRDTLVEIMSIVGASVNPMTLIGDIEALFESEGN